MSVSHLFPHNSLHIVHILTYAVYPGSSCSYLPGYDTAQPLRLMHGVHGRTLGTGFDPGLWGSVSVSQLFPHISLHIVHILIYTVYPGSTRSYLPGYITVQSLRFMHGGPDWMLDTGFDPGLWGSVSVSQLFPHISLHIVHILIYTVYPGSSRSYLPGYTTFQSLRLMHGVYGRMLGTGFDPGLWGSMSVSHLFPHNSLHIVHILIYVVYPGSTRSYLPGYITVQSLRFMHGGPDWMLDTGFDPGLWGWSR
jgi:saccharopine dehydrogenase-like NADP-dependent oxidoreductase